MIRKHILCDIDHTISDAFWRDELIGGPGGWDEYHSQSIKDDPLHDMVAMVNALHSSGLVIIGITARPAKWRSLTMRWLVKHSVMMDELLMRPDESFHPAPEIKTALAIERFGESVKDHVAMILDDREDVIEAFKGMGVTAIQVHGRTR